MKNKINKLEVYIPLFTILLDVVMIFSAYMLSFYIRFFTPFKTIFPVTEGYPGVYGYINLVVVSLPIWILIFQMNKMYKLNRNVFIFDEFPSVFRCVSISLFLSVGILFFYRGFTYSRLVFVLNWGIATILVLLGRYIMLKTEKNYYNKRIGAKIVAVVGTNDMAFKIYDNYVKNTFVVFRVLGYFSKSLESTSGIDLKYNYLGDYESIPENVQRLGIQKLLVSLSSEEHNDIYELMKICEGINVEFMLYPDFMEIITSKIRIEEINGVPFMKIKELPMNVWNRILKRIFDTFFSLLIMIILSPLFAIIGIIIKMTSPGPIFYQQERVSIGGKKFMMYKFRSMVINAEKDGPEFAKKGDSRYTKIGLFLRKFSLDELPQFINVLKGEMSVVGPRPEREFFIEQMKGNIFKYLERNRVKCGVTGWAAVNGYRGSGTSMQTRIEYDIYYIENWSLAFDVKIILKTLKEALFSKTAY